MSGVAPFGRFTVCRPVAEGDMVEHVEMFEAHSLERLTPQNHGGEVEHFECVTEAELAARHHADVFTLEAAASWPVG